MLLENGRAMEFLNIEKYTYLEEKHRGYLDQLKDFCKKARVFHDIIFIRRAGC